MDLIAQMAVRAVRAADPRLGEVVDVVEASLEAVAPDPDGVRRVTKAEQERLVKEIGEAVLAALPDVVELPGA